MLKMVFIILFAAGSLSAPAQGLITRRAPLMVLYEESRAVVFTLTEDNKLWFSDCVVAIDALKTDDSLLLNLNEVDNSCARINRGFLLFEGEKTLVDFDKNFQIALAQRFEDNAKHESKYNYLLFAGSAGSFGAAVFSYFRLDTFTTVLMGTLATLSLGAAFSVSKRSRQWHELSKNVPNDFLEQTTRDPRNGLDPRLLVDKSTYQLLRSALADAFEKTRATLP